MRADCTVASRVSSTPWRSLGVLAAEDVRVAPHEVPVELPEVLTTEDVRMRLDAVAAREARRHLPGGLLLVLPG